MRPSRPGRSARLFASAAFILLLASCAKPSAPGLAETAAPATTTDTPSGSAAAAAPETRTQAAASGAAAEAVPVAAGPSAPAARPWYAERLEKLGFYVFPEPVDIGDFSVEALKGGQARLSEARGKIVLLNFWATWCPPCRAEMPSIEVLWKKLQGKAFTIMGVSVGEKPATVRSFIAQEKFSFPIYLDPTGALGSAFNARSIPTTYLIDKEGRAIAGMVGSRQYDGPEVLALIEELAAK